MLRTIRSLLSKLRNSHLVPAILFSLLLVASCGEKPSGTSAGPPSNSGNVTIDPGTSGDVLLGTIEDDAIFAGRLEIWGFNLAADSQTVSFDVVIVNKTDRSIPPPIRWVITSIVPRDVFVENPDGHDGEGDPYFDFSDKLGDDSLLTPGERTEPAHAVFHTGPPRPFVIGYRLDFGPVGPPGVIAGVVFFDADRDGERARCELGMPGMMVILESRSPDGSVLRRETRTDHNGAFRFDHLAEGIYEVSAPVPPGFIATTPNPVLVTLVGDFEVIPVLFFGMYSDLLPREITLFGPVNVGPFSRAGTELDSTFIAPPDRCVFDILPGKIYFLEVQYPMIMGPFPLDIDYVEVAINDFTIYHYEAENDSTLTGPQPGTFPIEEGVIHDGVNSIHIEVQGGQYASLFFRVLMAIDNATK